MSISKNISHSEIQPVFDFVHINKGKDAFNNLAYDGCNSRTFNSKTRRAEVSVNEHPVEHEIYKA